MKNMAVIDLFSKRGKPSPASDVLTYDSLPVPLRVQIVHIWVGALGDGRSDMYEHSYSAQIWESIEKAICREHGVFGLAAHKRGFEAAVEWFMEPRQPLERLLDMIEITFRVIDGHVRDQWQTYERRSSGISESPDDAIAELNHRFLEHAVGYQYEARNLIRVDSTFAHSEVIKPALTILSDKRFRNAQTEFLNAHQAYREQRYSDCLNESLKAFESTMKIICTEKGWSFNATDTASRLIDVVMSNGLIATSLQNQFTGLRTMLESGTPTVRNKQSGHGMGAATIVIPQYVAAFGLQTAAANISLLGAAFEEAGAKRRFRT
jgi:hypothetical protein